MIELFTEEDVYNIKQITIEFHDWLNADLHTRTVNAIKKLKRLGFKGFTNSPNHSWPVEVIFLNKKFFENTLFNSISMRLFKVLTFLKY